MALYLDNCSHCACRTDLDHRYTRDLAIRELEDGGLGCWNCEDQQEVDPDGHYKCVVLYDDGEAIWDGRCAHE